MINSLNNMFAQANFELKNFFNIKHKKVPKYLLRKLKKDMIVIDCGANIGEVSFPLIDSGAKLFCFEPHPLAFKKLKQRFENVANASVYDVAVGVYEHKSKLYKHINSDTDELKYSTGSSLCSFKNNVNSEEYYEINVINLIDFIVSLSSKVFILKIDIEGAEVELVNHLIDKEVHKKIDYIFVETHEEKMPELFIPTNELKSKIKELKIRNIYTNWT
ncbi:FkbM family methyltransferase [Pedobacter sp. B4-66]|uniref:FkbM family methyltransferase n=1 Tax=Pedobacter sp. B4-66 TaxID=2817280 RepID=UPI001BDA75E8|nr:FkbM family methyltransferase [Pedobacter sp. B4-66]